MNVHEFPKFLTRLLVVIAIIAILAAMLLLVNTKAMTSWRTQVTMLFGTVS